MLQPRQLHPGGMTGTAGLEVVGDLDDGRHGLADLPEELQTDRARHRRHLMQHPARSHDQPVGAFLLHARHAAEELVGHVLAQSDLAAGRARHLDQLGAQRGAAERVGTGEAEAHGFLLVDLADVVVEPLHLQPVAVGRHHLPPREVVERGAPQHGLLAPGVHGDVAADARGAGRGRVDGKHLTHRLRRLGHARGDHARAGADGGIRATRVAVGIGQRGFLDRTDVDQLFGVDDDRLGIEGNGPARIAGAAAPRNDGEPQLDAGAHQRRHFVFGVGVEHHKRVLHPPVGGIGDMRDAGMAVKADVVARGVGRQRLQHRLAAALGVDEPLLEVQHGLACPAQQPGHHIVAGAAFIHLIEAVMQGIDQRLTALAAGQQIVFQIRVAAHHPDVAQHLVQHARAAPGHALGAQGFERRPGRLAQQTDDDLAVGERRVVVGNLAKSLIWHEQIGTAWAEEPDILSEPTTAAAFQPAARKFVPGYRQAPAHGVTRQCDVRWPRGVSATSTFGWHSRSHSSGVPNTTGSISNAIEKRANTS